MNSDVTPPDVTPSEVPPFEVYPSEVSPADVHPIGGQVAEVPPIEVRCPQCTVPADPQGLRCPSCREDLGVLFRLRYAARIDYNRALDALAAGDRAFALGLLHRAVAAEPGLEPARDLLEWVSASGSVRPVPGEREGDTPSE
ncbi:hypothetical protein [Kitasatospora sp. NPDC058478]|uniref:hypothetical protein n=1 Tax=unclassified Kitasatospora TaxID=2633591 RepID=UPI00364BA558